MPEISIDSLCREGLAELQTGPFGSQLHAYDYANDGVPVVPTEAIRSRRIDTSALPKITVAKATELSRHRLSEGDILFARRGAQATGQSAIVRGPEEGFICGTGAIRLRLKAENKIVLANYLSHVLAAPSSIEWIRHNAIGATMPNLNEGIIRRFSFNAPKLDEQERIAMLLDAHDDKIALNRGMNETLEAMAQAIFRDWFVDFGPTRRKLAGITEPIDIMGGLTTDPARATELAAIFPEAFDNIGFPEGWAKGVLGDVAEQVGEGVSPGSLSPETPYIGLEHMPRRSLALDNWGGAGKVTSGKLSFKRGDFLFGKLRPYFHKVGIAPIDGICSTDIVVLNSRDTVTRAFVIACISQEAFVAFTDRNSDGTKMPRTSWGRMASFEVALPTPAVFQAFNNLTASMFEKLVSNTHETRTLGAARDLLLPKLMSGEIHLRDAEALVQDKT